MKIFFTLVFVLVIFSCNERNNNIKVEHYENGGLKSIGRYKNKIINGQVQWFYPNGNIEQLVNFKNGRGKRQRY